MDTTRCSMSQMMHATRCHKRCLARLTRNQPVVLGERCLLPVCVTPSTLSLPQGGRPTRRMEQLRRVEGR